MSSIEDLALSVNEAPTLFQPVLPMMDDGRIDLISAPLDGASTLTTDGHLVRIGGQAPMFGQSDVQDAGLVRLGGQAPLFF